MVLRTAPKIPKSRNPEIQKSRNPEIPKPRNPEIAKSQDPEPPKSRSPEIPKSASRSGPLNPCMQCSLSAQISCASEVCFALWTGQPVQKTRKRCEGPKTFATTVPGSKSRSKRMFEAAKHEIAKLWFAKPVHVYARVHSSIYIWMN